MRNSRRNLVTLLTTMSALLLLGSVSSAAAGGHKHSLTTAHMALVGPDASLDCSDLQPAAGEDGTQAGPGSVSFVQHRDGSVSATVRFRGAQPSTTYFVRLIQVGDGTCPGDGAFVTTNKQGSARVTVAEDLIEGSDAMQVFVNIPETGEPPYYRASERFLLNP